MPRERTIAGEEGVMNAFETMAGLQRRLVRAELLCWAWQMQAVKWNPIEGAGWRLDMDSLGHDPTHGNLWLLGSWEDGPQLTDEAFDVLTAARAAHAKAGLETGPPKEAGRYG